MKTYAGMTIAEIKQYLEVSNETEVGLDDLFCDGGIAAAIIEEMIEEIEKLRIN